MIEIINSSFGDVSYKTKDSAGFDICANEDKVIPPRSIVRIKTGLFLKGEIERGKEPLLELQIRTRSSMAMKGIVVANSPGTVDADYREEIEVILYNTTDVAYEVKVGDRIAQGVLAVAFNMPGIRINDVKREGGFGSTGQ